MSTYFKSFSNVFSKNIVLLVISVVLLPITFWLWAGVPFYLIAPMVQSVTNSLLLSFMSANFSLALLFSLFFLPYHLKVAEDFARRHEITQWRSFLQIQGLFILLLFVLLNVILLSIYNS